MFFQVIKLLGDIRGGFGVVALGLSHYFIDLAFFFDGIGYYFLRQVGFVPVIDVEGMSLTGV